MAKIAPKTQLEVSTEIEGEIVRIRYHKLVDEDGGERDVTITIWPYELPQNDDVLLQLNVDENVEFIHSYVDQVDIKLIGFPHP